MYRLTIAGLATLFGLACARGGSQASAPAPPSSLVGSAWALVWRADSAPGVRNFEPHHQTDTLVIRQQCTTGVCAGEVRGELQLATPADSTLQKSHLWWALRQVQLSGLAAGQDSVHGRVAPGVHHVTMNLQGRWRGGEVQGAYTVYGSYGITFGSFTLRPLAR